MKRDKIACECNRVSYGKIEDAVNAGAASFEEVQEMTGCSKSCGKCREFIEHWVGQMIADRDGAK